MLDRRSVRICVELKNFYSIVDKQSGPLNHLHLATACFKSEESAKLSVLIPLLLLNELITSHILPRDYGKPNSNRQLISPYLTHLNHELGYFSKNKLSGKLSKRFHVHCFILLVSCPILTWGAIAAY